MNKKVFRLFLVRPTRYDDDGYPVHWWEGVFVPSNTLACMHAIARDAVERNVLGDDVEIVVETLDESWQPFDAEKIARKMAKDDTPCLLGLVGVQSNQMPRAVDLAKPFAERGLPVCIGGFHVSGMVSMFSGPTPEFEALMNQGISLFAGESEERRFDQLLIDANQGRLKAFYDYSKDLPDITGQPVPYTSAEEIKRSLIGISSIDLGRGCPFQCSFCCIINVQGRKSRWRSADDLEYAVRLHYQSGSRMMFITDDNFARNKYWETFLDRLIALRKEGIEMRFTMQVDTLAYRIPNFVKKCAKAGVVWVFIGLENINPDNLRSMNKRQNITDEYREMLMAWKKYHVITWCAYIIGHPNDTRASILRDVEYIKRELPTDLLVFTILTPLPGSEDHKRLLENGTWIDPDLNNYDLTHVVTPHPVMSKEELLATYVDAWKSYYSFDHMVTVLRRMFALGSDRRFLTVKTLTAAGLLTQCNNLFSYDTGIIQRKSRKSRRPGMALENPVVFYTKYLLKTTTTAVKLSYNYWKLRRKMLQIGKDPARLSYTDEAIAPFEDDENKMAS